MKVLNFYTLLLLLSSATLLANENNASLDEYISDLKKAQFNYDYQKNEAQGSILRDSWIAPLNLNYSHSTSNPYDAEQVSQAAAIKMDQPIFQSGGIYYGIKFANASKEYADYSVDVAKRKMIKDAITLLMQIKQSEIRVKRQNFQIKNSEINLEQKKEQYLSGQLDSGFLDSAIIERNLVIQALYDIETSREKLIASFKAISDLPYKEAPIPHLELLNEEEFLKNNIVLKMTESQNTKDDYNKNVTVAKYLPKVSVTAGYNWSKSEGQLFKLTDGERDYYDYGFKVNMPLNINTFRDIESAKVDFLKSQIKVEDEKRALTSVFVQVLENIKKLDKKIVLSVENRELYAKLLEDTKSLFNAGYKTEYDIETLQNSVQIQELDSKIFELDRQLELLTLYEMYVND
ncbi:MAG: TolC family protein [Sulfurimonas sp.]|nr:TolC family protein [Sulfurimonas sp.]MBU1215880.1 TolC family protein [bacterium]MBU1435559.1 TolC family protein [bacterium]MBU1502517.1 TolC family protein [bacterium]MBU3938160.1 TolC family protein [bacterium]